MNTDAMVQEQPIYRDNLLNLVSTWVLCSVLLVLASMYGFSFEKGIGNTAVGAKEQGLTAGASQDSGIVRIQNAGMYVLCLMLMLPLIEPITAEFRRNALISVLLVWVVASCVWSDDPGASMTNGIRMTLDVAFSFYLSKRYATNDLLKLLLLLGSVAAAGSIFLIFVFPRYGLQNREILYAFGAWQGIFGQKNICGRVMTLLLLPAFFVRVEGRWARIYRVFYIALVLVIIVMSQSAGSWLLCGSCLAFIGAIYMLRRLTPTDALSVGAVLFGILLAAILVIGTHAETAFRLIGKDPGMTGRVVIWSSLILSVLKHPFLGYGYMAFWRGLAGESANTILRVGWPGMGYAENGVLELWLELGAIGVFLYAIVFFRAVRDALFCFRREASQSTMWFMSVLFYLAFSNLWAGNLLLPSTLECIVPFIAYVGLRQEARRLHGLLNS